MGIIKYENDGLEKVYTHESFEKEFRKMFGKSKRDLNKEIEWFHRQLKRLENDFDLYKDPEDKIFEKLTNTKVDLYSIRHKSLFNPRYLYFTIEDEAIILVTAFRETRKSDYEDSINRATERTKQIKEEIGQ